MLTITAIDKSVFNHEAVYCRVVTPSGTIGFEARHEAFLAILKEHSTIMFKAPSGTETSLIVASGMLSFRDNKCLITVCLPVINK
jgi:F0F1-type ATP synthase epsilon subunit